jgi:hypothetical protein
MPRFRHLFLLLLATAGCDRKPVTATPGEARGYEIEPAIGSPHHEAEFGGNAI